MATRTQRVQAASSLSEAGPPFLLLPGPSTPREARAKSSREEKPKQIHAEGQAPHGFLGRPREVKLKGTCRRIHPCPHTEAGHTAPSRGTCGSPRASGHTPGTNVFQAVCKHVTRLASWIPASGDACLGTGSPRPHLPMGVFCLAAKVSLYKRIITSSNTYKLRRVPIRTHRSSCSEEKGSAVLRLGEAAEVERPSGFWGARVATEVVGGKNWKQVSPDSHRPQSVHCQRQLHSQLQHLEAGEQPRRAPSAPAHPCPAASHPQPHSCTGRTRPWGIRHTQAL